MHNLFSVHFVNLYMFWAYLDLSSGGKTICIEQFQSNHDNSKSVAYPGILFQGGVSTNSIEDTGQREQGSGSGSPLVRGSGGSSNLVQEISFHIVKFS